MSWWVAIGAAAVLIIGSVYLMQPPERPAANRIEFINSCAGGNTATREACTCVHDYLVEQLGADAINRVTNEPNNNNAQQTSAQAVLSCYRR